MKLKISSLILLLSASIALADNGHGHDHGGDVTTDVTSSTDVTTSVTGGDVNIAGDSSRAYGIGHSLGDVDISQCLGSVQWGSPVFSRQKLVINWPCMAEFYLRNGEPKLAAMAVCNTEVIKEFADEAECEAAHQFLSTLEPAVPVLPSSNVEEEEYHEEQEQTLAMLEMRVSEIQALVEKSQRPVVRREVIEKKGGLTEEQKAALRETVK